MKTDINNLVKSFILDYIKEFHSSKYENASKSGIKIEDKTSYNQENNITISYFEGSNIKYLYVSNVKLMAFIYSKINIDKNND